MRKTARLVPRSLLDLAAVFIAACLLPAQTRQILAWQEDLANLQNASGDELIRGVAAVEQIRNGIELWLKMHPDSDIKMRPAPRQPWSEAEMRGEVSALSEAVESILKEDPGRPFNLGMTTVSVTAEGSPLSPVSDSVDRSEIVNRRSLTASAALDYLPGVAIDHATAGRNEAGIRIRGFTSKGQVSFYIDGIQVTMPYDGTIDFNRFLANDTGEIQVSKGFSSPLLGPNALGGSINLVTREPEKKYEADVLMGTGSAGMFLSSVNFGSRWEKFYAQGSFGWLQSDFVPLSGNFPLNAFQPTSKRINSDSRDANYSGRFAWTPRSGDQYVFSYINQKAQKGVPLYAGPNSSATFRPSDYRRWPYWNKTAYYLITNTGLGESGSIRFRAYYDQFPNEFDFYDDATFSTMMKTSSNHSYYDDHSAGGSAEYTTRALSRNVLSASIYFRDDNHKERMEYPARSPFPYVTPTLLDRAQTLSMGFQDVITLSSRLRATVGFSADYMKGSQVQRLNRSETILVPITCAAEPDNTSFSGCTARMWNYNPQGSLSYAVTSVDTLYLTIADRGRFPLLKDSYSYRLGTGIPNPDLKPEHNTSINAGYSHAFPGRTLAQLEYFYNRLRDAIAGVYVVDSASLCSNTGAQEGYCSQNVNIARQVHQGFEFSLRSRPVSRVMLDLNYSYLNRTMVYDFGDRIDISQVLTTINYLPTYPKNKVIFDATLRLPREILAIASFRYEGGITLQDTTYPRTSPNYLPFGTSYGVVDLGAIVPIHAGFSAQVGVKNLFDRDYYYAAGYPEAGRNWYLNLRYSY